jgi:predicted amidohydrolase
MPVAMLQVKEPDSRYHRPAARSIRPLSPTKVSRAGNLAAIERLLASAVAQRADAVLFPETAVTGYACDFAALKPAEIRGALAAVGALAAAANVNVLLGSPVFRRRKLYNCLVVFNRSGRIEHCYAKNHLTESDQQYFARGNALALFAIDGVPATAVICHERRYPELVRLPVMAGAQTLFHPNAGMDALALADNQHEAVIAADLDLAQASRAYAVRALEYPRFLAKHWKQMVSDVRARAEKSALDFDLP